ncbi:MAG: hypothetical protein V3U75_12005 [Methylococcaceae bacterium]
MGILFFPYSYYGKKVVPGLLLLIAFFFSIALGISFASGNSQRMILSWVHELDQWSLQFAYLATPLNWFAELCRDLAQEAPLVIALALSLLVFWVYFVVRTILLLITGLISKIIGGLVWVYQKLTGSVNKITVKPSDWMYQAFFLKHSQWFLLGVLISFLALLPWWLNKLNNVALNTYFSALIWVGVWIVLLEIGAFLRSLIIEVEQAEQFGTGAGETSAGENNSYIYKLFTAYITKYSDCLLGQRVAEDQSDDGEVEDNYVNGIRAIFKAQMPPHQANKAQQAYRYYLENKDVVITETLTYFHLILFMEMIMHCIHNKGAVLVVVPSKNIDDFKRDLKNIFDSFYGRFSLCIHDWMHEAPAHRDQTDLHFCTVENLEAFIARPLVVDKVKLMLVLHMHALDRALLRYEYGRMDLMLNKALIKVCQVQEYQNDELAVRSTLITEQIREIKLIPTRHQDKPPVTLVWKNSAATENRLKTQYYNEEQCHIDIAPMLMIDPMKENRKIISSAVWLDENYRFDADQHEYLSNQKLASTIRVHHLFEELAPGLKMIIVEDMNNIIFNLNRNVHIFPDEKYLLHIISHNYLLRDFMLETAKGRHGLSPRLGVIAGRDSDLARQIFRALKFNHNGITEQELEIMIERAGFSGRVTPDYQGLSSLLRNTLGFVPDLSCRIEDGSSRFILQSDQNYSPYKTLAINHAGHEQLLCFSSAEYGLSYAPGILLQLVDKFYRIKKVTDKKIEVTHEPRFCAMHRIISYIRRHYIINKGHKYSFPDSSRGNLALQMVRYDVSYSRQSFGYIDAMEKRVPNQEFTHHRFEEPIYYENPSSSALLIRIRVHRSSQEEIGLDRASCKSHQSEGN